MGNFTFFNKNHWKNLEAGAIIGRNAFPGDELFKHLAPGSRILDLGCGTGEISEFLAGLNYSVTAIDINTAAITQNKALTQKVNYILGDITQKLPFPNASFEAIVISFVLVSIISQPDRESLVSELMRVLKPNGILWVNEGLISNDYNKRYELSSSFLKSNDHDFYVFNDGTSSTSIQSEAQLEQAINDGKVARIAHHFSAIELKKLFKNCTVVYEKESETASPNTKSIIKMIILVFKTNIKTPEIN